jgi:hypothetical protein
VLARSNAPGQYHAFRSPPGGTGRLLAAAATRAEATACLEREVVARAVTAGGKLGDGGTAGGGYDVALCTRVSGLHVTSSVCTLCRAAARRRLRLRPALAASHDGVDACASGSASANTCGVVYVGLAYPSPLAPSATHAGRQERRGRQRGKAVGVVASSRQTETPTPHLRCLAPPAHGRLGRRGRRARAAPRRSCALVRAAAGPTCRRVRYEYMRDLYLTPSS